MTDLLKALQRAREVLGEILPADSIAYDFELRDIDLAIEAATATKTVYGSTPVAVTIFASGDNENTPQEAVHHALAYAHKAGFIDGWSDPQPASAEIEKLRLQLVSKTELVRRLIVEFDDYHYPGCPKDSDDGARCECFAGALIDEAKNALSDEQAHG